VYLFTPEIFGAIEQIPVDPHGEIQLTAAIQKLIEKNRKVYAVELTPNEKRIDIGNPTSYFQAINILARL
jgi:UTP-glucose-1-phosphate uridylyltransferase